MSQSSGRGFVACATGALVGGLLGCQSTGSGPLEHPGGASAPEVARDQAAASPVPAEGSARVVSLLNPGEVERLGGLPDEAIVGFFGGDSTAPDAFVPNPQFRTLMHQVLRKVGPSDPGLREAARRQEDGWIYIIDLRTPDGPQGRVPPEDMVGAFQVKGGQLIADSYLAMETHKLLTEHGLVQLPPSLKQAVVDELLQRPVSK